jgi:hypothetical protein
MFLCACRLAKEASYAEICAKIKEASEDGPLKVSNSSQLRLYAAVGFASLKKAAQL